jgi:hypothetical protein
MAKKFKKKSGKGQYQGQSVQLKGKKPKTKKRGKKKGY